MPDAIAAYDFNGATYIVTANEGDARDYDGFSEEARVNSLTLDPAVFPDASLQNNANLGRLTVTTVGADSNEDGLVDRLIAFGARSFSIWSGNGSLMYDSGSDFEVITALRYGDAWNSNHEENGGDNRSDNKGPEPEGLALATIDGSTYAFIGLERMGGIMVYDITNPQSPRFQHYTNNRDLGQEPGNGDAGDLGPEGLFYIPASDSPNGSTCWWSVMKSAERRRSTASTAYSASRHQAASAGPGRRSSRVDASPLRFFHLMGRESELNGSAAAHPLSGRLLAARRRNRTSSS